MSLCFPNFQLDSIAYKDKQREKLRRQKMAQWAANRIAEEEAEDGADGGDNDDSDDGSSSDVDDAEAGSAGRARKGIKRAAPWSEQQERKRRREERRAKYGSSPKRADGCP